MGRGHFVVNIAAEQRKNKAADKRISEAQAKAETNKAAFAAVVAEMNAAFGPFDVETGLGLDMLNRAVCQSTGKDLGQHRNQRIEA